MLSLKQVESNYLKKEPCNDYCCSWIIKFSYCLKYEYHKCVVLLTFKFELKIALHAAPTRKKVCEVTTFDTFLRRVNFILTFFQEKLVSLLSVGKPFSGYLED